MSEEMQKPDNYLVWTILVTILCCLPLGVVGIIYSTRVDSLWNSGKHKEAVEASNNAKLFAIISAALGFVAGIISFFIGFIEAL